jgi:Tfp pilus assembly protein PilF
MDAFDEAIRIDPEHADAYEARGEAYLKMGETAKAEADCKKAEQLRMDPE